ncbi:MAG: hypothetical protein IPM13_09130 [Phycisphaerales bacterium]|nr:hypothetical protein [Phycisphaerales bacterium]
MLPALVERYDYDPYGATYIAYRVPSTYDDASQTRDPNLLTDPAAWQPCESSRFGNPLLWTAQRYDPAVRLYHFLFRTYSPTLGRWMQRDPAGYVDGVSLYTYVASSPTCHVDPLGLTYIISPYQIEALIAELRRRPDIGGGLRGRTRTPSDQKAPTNGCSSPFGDAPSGVNFRGACDEHDRCYQTLGKSRFECDNEFYADMAHLCLAYASSEWQLAECLRWAMVYYIAVRVFGGWADLYDFLKWNGHARRNVSPLEPSRPAPRSQPPYTQPPYTGLGAGTPWCPSRRSPYGD